MYGTREAPEGQEQHEPSALTQPAATGETPKNYTVLPGDVTDNEQLLLQQKRVQLFDKIDNTNS